MEGLYCKQCSGAPLTAVEKAFGGITRFFQPLEHIKDYRPPEGYDSRQRLFRCPVCKDEVYISLTFRQFKRLFFPSVQKQPEPKRDPLKLFRGFTPRLKLTIS